MKKEVKDSLVYQWWTKHETILSLLIGVISIIGIILFVLLIFYANGR